MGWVRSRIFRILFHGSCGSLATSRKRSGSRPLTFRERRSDRPRSIVLPIFAYGLMEHRGPIVRPWKSYVTKL